MSENIERFNPYCGCVENVSECNTVVKRVSEVPSLGDATRNHVYLLPDNTAWIVNSDGTGFSQLNGSGAGEAYDDTDLKERLEELESKPDNDTKYNLVLDTKTLLRSTSLKELIEAYTGTDQPLLGNPNILGDFIQYAVNLAGIKFIYSSGNQRNDIYIDDVEYEVYNSTGITNKGAMRFIQSHTSSINGGDELGASPVGVNYTVDFHYNSNRYIIHWLLSVYGDTIPIYLDLVDLKEQFESNPSEPVKTATITTIEGRTITVDVLFDENFYNDTKSSVISRGRYKLNEL